MNKIIDRYLAQSILAMIGVVSVVFLGVITFSQFLSEAQDIGVRSYGLWQAIWYVVMVMVAYLYHFFPIIAFLSCLLALGHLASGSELIVMRSSGMSIKSILFSVLKFAFVMVLAVTFIGEGLAPHLERLAKATKARQMSGGQALQTAMGTWVRSGDGFTHIDSVDSEKQLKGVTHYQFDEQQRLKWSGFAPIAEHDGEHWILKQAETSDLTHGSVSAQYQEKQLLNMDLPPHALLLTKISPDNQTLSDLYQSIKFRGQHALNASALQLNFWQRLMQPLVTVLLFLLAVPFVFGPLRQANTGLRFLSGVLMGFSFYTLDRFFGPFAVVYQLPPLLAAVLPSLIYLALGVGMLVWKRQ